MSEGLERDWHARYERWATAHASEHLVSGWSERGLARRLALVLRSIRAAGVKPGGRILDLGVGPGTYARSLKEFGFSCLGLDYSGKVLEVAKRKDRAGDYVQAEAYNLPLKQKSFDSVICIGVLQSLMNLNQAVAEMSRVLHPGGHLFLDGLNSLFWLHSYRTLKERIDGRDKRMSYYDPFRLRRELAQLGFDDVTIHWLAMPESLQTFVRLLGGIGGRCCSRLFGYAFLISARKCAFDKSVAV
jgi:2-polyprenyl-3-methyl-5-hydroxy-6-metoxy-1,4-benzoquinol methylase